MLAVTAALLSSCGESRQEKFERALREVKAARVDLEAASEQLAKSESSYAEARKAAEHAEAELEAARGDVDSATNRLEGARAEALKWAPDGALPPEMQPAPTLPHTAPETTDEPSFRD